MVSKVKSSYDVKVTVAICTRNPRTEVFKQVLKSLENQTTNSFNIIVIDNASDGNFLNEFQNSKNYELVKEPRVGNAWSRYSALRLFQGDLLIFVDDDNILDEKYIETACELYINNPTWGAFGGKQIRSSDLKVSKSKEFMLPYLAIRDLGDIEKSDDARLDWCPIEPVGAGMCLRSEVVKEFLNCKNLGAYFKLGRSGKGLLSGEDSFIARHCFFLSLKYGYSPNLVLEHRIKRDRIKLNYLIRLMFGYGRSDIRLSYALSQSLTIYPSKASRTLKIFLFHASQKRLGFLLGLRTLGQYWEFRKQGNNQHEHN